MRSTAKHVKVNPLLVQLRKLASIVLALGVVIAGLTPANAVNSIALVASSATVNPNGSITLTATQPLAQAGVIGQTLVHHFDNTKFHLTSAAQIVAPNGWTIYYSTDDGATWTSTTPVSANEWAAVNAVKAAGTLDTAGSNGSNQIATQAAQGISALGVPYKPHGNGDGWEAIADTTGHVWNVFHHNGNGGTQALDCHLRTSDSCGSAYPYSLAALGINTSNRPYLVVDETNHRLLMPTLCSGGTNNPCGANEGTYGVFCLDVSNPATPSPCGGAANGFIKLGNSTGNTWSDFVAGAVIVGTKLYTLDGGAEDSGQTFSEKILMCLDLNTYAKCASSPYAINSSLGASFPLFNALHGYSDLVAIGSMVFGAAGEPTSGNIQAFCWNGSTNTACTGWTNAKAVTTNGNGDILAKLLEVKDSAGTVTGVCAIPAVDEFTLEPSSAIKCFTLAGANLTTPAWVVSQIYPKLLDPNAGGGNNQRWSFLQQTNKVQWVGTRAYWATAGESPNGSSATYNCYDVSTSAVCANWPAVRTGVWLAYSINTDPINPNCLWTNVDTGGILPVDAITGLPGCNSSPGLRADFRGSSALPRMGCSSSGLSNLASYTSIQMTGPTAAGSFTMPKLSIADSSGAAISGWQDLVPTSTNAGLPVWDVTALNPSLTGASPTISVSFATYTSSTFASLSVTAVSSPAQLCISPVAVANCGPQGFFDNATPLSASTASFSAEGSSTTNSMTTNIPGTSASATINAPVATDCQAKLMGQTWQDGAVTGSWTNVTGVTVTLAGANGQALLDANGQPLTALVASNGTFAFNNIVPGNYTVIFPDSTNPNQPATNVHKTSIGTGQTLGGWTKIPSGDNFTSLSAASLTTSAVPVAVGLPATVFGYYLPGPVAPSRAETAPAGTSITFDPYVTLGNSAAASATPSSSFTGAGAIPVLTCPVGGTSCSASSVTIPNQGTYSVNSSTKQVTFTPLPAFTGTATPVTYTVTDAAGNSAQGTLTPTFYAPPSATPDAQTTAWDVNQTYSPAANDSVGLDASTIKLCGPAQMPNNCTQTTLVVANVGTYTVTNGTVVFDPLPTFTGTAAAVTYQISTGGVSPSYASSTITPTITPTTIAATPQSLVNQPGPNQSMQFTALDRVNGLSTSSVSLTTSSTCLFLQSTPNTCVSSVTTADGTWTLNATTGVVTFTSSNTTAANAVYSNQIGYKVTNAAGQTATSTLTITTAAPVTALSATPDAITTAYDTNQVYSPAVNDSSLLVASTVKLCAAGQTPLPFGAGCSATTLVVPNQGTFTVNANGTVGFDPLPTFIGTASPVMYQLATGTSGSLQYGASTITPTILPPVIQATPQTLPNQPGSGKSVIYTPLDLGASALANSSAPLDPTKACLFLQSAPKACQSSVTSAHGTFVLDAATGLVKFTSAASVGATDSYTDVIGYRAFNIVGQSADSTLTVYTAAPTIAKPDKLTDKQGIAQSYDILNNDVLDPGVSLQSGTIKLCLPGTLTCGSSKVVVPGQGTYEVLSGGTVKFTPEPNFTGRAASIRYSVKDSLGRTVASTITPTVTPGPVLAYTGDAVLMPLTWAGLMMVVFGLLMVVRARRVE